MTADAAVAVSPCPRRCEGRQDCTSACQGAAQRHWPHLCAACQAALPPAVTVDGCEATPWHSSGGRITWSGSWSRESCYLSIHAPFDAGRPWRATLSHWTKTEGSLTLVEVEADTRDAAIAALEERLVALREIFAPKARKARR